MTWSTLKAFTSTADSSVALFAQIAGIPEVLSTSKLSPVGLSFYDDGGHTASRPWLKWEGVALDELAAFMDGTLEVAPLTLKVVDPDGGFTALCESWLSRARTRLTSTLSSTETASMTVATTTGYVDTDGVVWIRGEAIGYATKDATHFLTLTRGLYGTRIQEHAVDAARRPVPLLPAVLNGPQSFIGRRVYIWACQVTNGDLSAEECIYRGYITPDSDPDPGGATWTLNVEHITQWLTREVGTELPHAELRPGYYFGDMAQPGIQVFEINAGTGAVANEATVKVPIAHYSSFGGLANALNTALITATTGWNRAGPRCFPNVDGTVSVYSPADSTYTHRIIIPRNSALDVLGFGDGSIDLVNDGAAAQYVKADDAPALFSIVASRGDSALPYCWTSISGSFGLTDDAYVVFGKAKDCSPWIGLATYTAATGHCEFSLEYDELRVDGATGAIGAAPFVWRAKEQDDLVLRHVIKLSGVLTDVFKQLTHLSTTQIEPESWVLRGFVAADFSWTELTAALVGTPGELQQVNDCLTDPTAFDKLLIDRLGLLCIAPRVTTAGAIGFVKLRVPNVREASAIELDSKIWAQFGAADVRTQVAGDPLVNQIVLRHSFNYRTGDWAEDCSIGYDDGISEFCKTTSHIFELRGLMVGVSGSPWYFPRAEQLVEVVSDHAVGMHFGLFGRSAAVISIPCVWRAKQYNIGDIIKVTHPTIVDVELGTIGTEDRLGVITGRIGAVTDQGYDFIRVYLPAPHNVAGWAPAALGTSWDAGSKTLTFAEHTLFAQSGADDLDEFAAGDTVRITSWDNEVSTVYGNGIIDSKAAGSLTFTTDPFGGSFPASPAKVLVTLPDYDDASETQRLFCYQGDTAMTIGTAAVEAKTWGP